MYLGEELEAFIREYQLSQAQVARSIGRSPALLNKYIKGTYEARDVQALEKSIKDFMRSYKESATERKQLKNLEIKALSNLNNAHFVIDQAVVCKESCLLYGLAGSGKSESLKAYANKTPQAILFESVPGLSNTDFLNGLSVLIGAVSASSVPKLILNISKRLAERESVILIDEAEHLKTASLEALRRIVDFTKVPMILTGTPQLLTNLKGKKGELLQLYSRISLKYEFHTPSAHDFTLLFGDYAELISSFTHNLRRACKIWKMSNRFAQIDGRSLEESIRLVVSMSILD
ncbi:AAA family ATPase [Helicobacter suis]|uniref:AAA family ATPase n=1 Tax=Helicobacter suis TaxID=104628 RepID=UPI0013D639BD|nr:AAA family ATPase [Helicobacter suis]